MDYHLLFSIKYEELPSIITDYVWLTIIDYFKSVLWIV